MDVELKGFAFRPMQSNDDPTKLSLGDSAHAPLKIFLKKNAFDFHQCQIAKTYVLIKSGSSQIWGYITLVNSEISLNCEQRPPEPIGAARYDTFPAVKIARLAVDKRLQRNGFGRMMLEWAVSHVRISIMPHVGCRFIVVDTKDSSFSFYQRAGFVLLNTQASVASEYPVMFFDLAKITNPFETIVKSIPILADYS